MDDATSTYEPEDVTAARIAERLLSFDRRIAAVREQARVTVDRLERQRARFDRFARPLLEEFYARHVGGRTKTITLATATLSRRRVAGGPRVIDEKALLAWAAEHAPALVRVKEVRDVPTANVRAHLETVGELPAGVELVGDAERFYIRPPKE